MDIIVKTLDAVHNVIDCDAGIAQDLSDYFTFEAPGARFIIAKARKIAKKTGKAAKFSGWDGKIRLFSKATHKMYAGLTDRLKDYAFERDLTFGSFNPERSVINKETAKRFIEGLDIPPKFEERYYQIDAFIKAINEQRLLILSPTSSGKSLMIYYLFRWYLEQVLGKVLIIVPSLGLVQQMYNDFRSYGYDVTKVHQLMGGTAKDAPQRVYLSTWQSIYELPKAYFDQFDVVICDEVHGADAKSIKGIMENLTTCYYRFGFTGTLKETQCHRLVLEGLFGQVYQAITTREMIDQGYASELQVKCILLNYPELECYNLRKATYPEELLYIVKHKGRNNFIKNLTLSLDGNILVLFRLVEEHGKVLYDLIKSETNQPVYFIAGETPGDEREQIRQIVDSEKNAILIGSTGCVSTGINIPNIHHIVFASPYKARVKVLQSIGRGLRLSDRDLTVYDISDDLSWKSHQNFSLLHFVERVKIYNEEKFDYKIFKVPIWT